MWPVAKTKGRDLLLHALHSFTSLVFTPQTEDLSTEQAEGWPFHQQAGNSLTSHSELQIVFTHSLKSIIYYN